MNMHKIGPALALAGVMITMAIGVSYAKLNGYIDGDSGIRIFMVMNGLMLAYYANAAPKKIARTERSRTMRRITGWVFTLASLGYAAVWAFAPMETANIASMGLLGAGILIVLGYCVLARAKASAAP